MGGRRSLGRLGFKPRHTSTSIPPIPVTSRLFCYSMCKTCLSERCLDWLPAWYTTTCPIVLTNMAPLVLQRSQTARRGNGCRSVHASCTPQSEKAKPIIHVWFCLGKLGATLENKQPETRALHLSGSKALMSCRVMAALPCRHTAKASPLNGVVHEGKWVSISLDVLQNGPLKCTTPSETRHCTYTLGRLR